MFTKIIKSVAIWFIILVCAIINGALREAALVPIFGTTAAFIASGILLSSCILLISLWLVPWLGKFNHMQAVGFGALWLGLTLAFEFGFGSFIMNRSLNELLEAYTFKNGNLWPIVLVVTFAAPILSVRLRGKS